MKNENILKESKKLVVLYAEDEEDTREQIVGILNLFFKKVFTASNGEEAYNLYKKNISEIDLIITDLTMPIMNGLEFIKKVKCDDKNAHVIVLTAHNSSENLMETIDLQLDGFLLKPIKMDRMQELLFKVTHTINLEKNEQTDENS